MNSGSKKQIKKNCSLNKAFTVLAKSENVERRILSQNLRTIIKKIELNLNQYDTALFISKISNNMSSKEKTKLDVFEISRH
jgi:transcription initiation factor TFIIB